MKFGLSFDPMAACVGDFFKRQRALNPNIGERPRVAKTANTESSASDLKWRGYSVNGLK
ncbi:hypothetical protein [Rhizobium leguminosarum]|uniref:hypothetical protein n=1 Tax=Rhizobium leguminosarum TaxID=384 RepID=UPI0003FC5B1C|nr:hypothetical protein [Rhizobium leguminosarum]